MTEKGSKQEKIQKEYEFPKGRKEVDVRSIKKEHEFPKGWEEVDVRSIKKEHEFPREYELAIRKKRVSR